VGGMLLDFTSIAFKNKHHFVLFRVFFQFIFADFIMQGKSNLSNSLHLLLLKTPSNVKVSYHILYFKEKQTKRF